MLSIWLLLLTATLTHRITRLTKNFGPKFESHSLRPTTEALKVSPIAASPYAYPFMGLITDNKKQCGGCFVTHNVVVTAAHCLGNDRRYIISSFNVILHRYRLNASLESDGATKFNVTRVFIHPKYNISVDAAAPHDVAVLVVNNDKSVIDGVDLDNSVRIDRGEYSKEQEGARLLGWGTTSEELILANSTSQIAEPTLVMKEMNLVIRPEKDCLTNYDIPCKGDSGGPLIHLPQEGKDTLYTLVGIVSFGSTNCTQNTVFTRVASYSEFITSKIERTLSSELNQEASPRASPSVHILPVTTKAGDEPMTDEIKSDIKASVEGE
ncbi:hypothetical protein L0F63_001039 [Massospora cicadina]|nr:hypothetical protein L0F63_001039 [Massospora cicadina]